MAQKIILADFDIDSKKLDDKIASNRTSIGLLRTAYNDASKELKAYEKEAIKLGNQIAGQKFLQDKANQSLKNGTISQSEYNKIIAETSKEITKNELELAGYIELLNKEQHTMNDLQEQMKALRLENNELNKLYNNGQTELTGLEGKYKELSDKLEFSRKSAQNLGAELLNLEKAGQKGSITYNELKEKLSKATEETQQLDKELKELDETLGLNQRNVGNYSDAIKENFGNIYTGLQDLKSGDVTAGLEAIKGGFNNLFQSLKDGSKALLTNPYTAVLVGVTALAVGISKFVKEVFDYNKQVSDLNKTVEQLTNTTGKVTDSIRINAQATADTFGREFNDVVKEVNSLMVDFGLKSNEAFKIYNDGLARGGNLNAEFGDSIREYGELFRQNGYSAQEFLNILNAGIDLDLYSDKLPDAIKEAGISLNEQTPATRMALENAFGSVFTNDILARINTGKTTVKEALNEISAQAVKTGLTQQQQAQLTADIFRGAGEDAGGAIKIFQALDNASKINNTSLTATQRATLAVAQANRELNEAKEKAMRSDSVISFQKAFEIALIKVETWFYKLVTAGRSVANMIENVTGFSKSYIGNLQEQYKLVQNVISIFTSFRNIIQGVATSTGVSGGKFSEYNKEIFKVISPIDLMRRALQNVNNVLSQLNVFITNNQARIIAFGNTFKNVFSTIGNAVKNFDISNPIESFKNLTKVVTSIDITSIYKKEESNAKSYLETQKKVNAQLVEDQKATTKKREAELEREQARAELLQEQRDKKEKARKEKIRSEEAKALGINLDESQGGAGKTKPERSAFKEVNKASNNLESKTKESEDLARKEVELALEKSNLFIEAGKNELANYIAINGEKLKDEKRFTQEKVNLQKEYLDEVEKKTKAIQDLEEQVKIKTIQDQLDILNKKTELTDLEKKQKENLEMQKQNIQLAYDTMDIERLNALNTQKSEIDKAFANQNLEDEKLRKALEFEKKLQKLEEDGATEYELKTEILDNQRTLDLEKLEQDRINGLISLENFELQKKVIEDKYRQEKKILEEAEIQARLTAYSDLFGNISQLLGEQTKAGKVAALAQIGISQGLAIARVWEAKDTLPSPFNIITKVAQTGIAVGNVLNALKKVNSVKASRGMLLQGKSHAEGGIPFSVDKQLGFEAEGGEAIINKQSTKMFKPLLSKINQLGGGVAFDRGGVLKSVTANSMGNGLIDYNFMKEAIMEGALQGTYNGSQNGIEMLSLNKKVRNESSI